MKFKTTYPYWLIKLNRGSIQFAIMMTFPLICSVALRNHQYKKFGRLRRNEASDPTYNKLVKNSYVRQKYLYDRLISYTPDETGVPLRAKPIKLD